MNRPDNYAVNPDTGDVIDQEGNLIGNLGDVPGKERESTRPGGITIYLRGSELDPVHVTSVIGIEPDVSWKKGDITGKIRPIEQKSGLWQLEIPGDTDSINEAVALFKGNTKSFSGIFTEIEGVDNAEIDVLIFLQSEGGSGNYMTSINPKTLKWIATSGATFSFSIYDKK